MNTKHTPGPWVKHSEHGYGPRLIIKANDAVVARVSALEDARLIAAAPELLAALRLTLREIEYCIEDGTLPEDAVNVNGSIVFARSAIAKATNETL